MNDILVSVIIITYNQEEYIAQAINSVLSQRVNFKYELIVSDDCSTDRTTEIINEYAKNYDIIKPVLNKANLKASKNYMQAVFKAMGKYIVVFEGDDYWIDDNKLQAQVDFLKDNPSYCAISHVIQMRDNGGNIYGQAPIENAMPDNEATMNLFLKGITFSCMATMYKANILKNENQSEYFNYVTAHPMVADFALCMLFLNAGRVKLLPQVMSVYRISAAQNQNSTSYNHNNDLHVKYADYIKVLGFSRGFFGKKYNFNYLYLSSSASICIESILNGGLKRFFTCFSNVPPKVKCLFVFYLPYRCLKLLFDKICKRGNEK